LNILNKTHEGNDAATESAPRFSHRNRLFLGVALILLLLVIVLAVFKFNSGPSAVLKSRELNLLVADSAEERNKGLSGRDNLGVDQAMLFVFEESGKHCFWMKDMKFDIDILWFDAARKLIHQERKLSPDTYPESYCADKDALYVLEVVSGMAEELDLRDDDQLQLKNF